MMKVSTKCCSECLFSDRKIVSERRKADVLAECARKGNHFVCHKATIAGESVGCRGFYETQPSQAQQVASRLGFLEFVDVEALKPCE